jgi:hypothetical protein
MSANDYVASWVGACASGESLAYPVVVAAMVAGCVFRVVASLLYGVTVGRQPG